MRAVWNALIEFQEEIHGENLLIRCDNATVVAYINNRTLLCGYPCRGTPLKIFLSCCHHIKCVASMGKTGILKCSPSNALIEFQEEIHGENLLIRCDNATVVAYINKQGGTKSILLCLLLWKIFLSCCHHIKCVASMGKTGILKCSPSICGRQK
jgi:hypothetical protein